MSVSPAWERMRAAHGKEKDRKPWQRPEFPAGTEHARAGDWYASACGCLGQYRTKEHGRLVWINSQPCKAHVPPFDPATVPECTPIRRVKRAPVAPTDSIWALPCRICDAPNHDKHDLNCVFWVVSDHTPF